jgi:uncharacterized iron-regulated membrane protein
MGGARAVRVWARVHTWTSLISMLFLLMLCITGLPLIFHDEIDDLFEHEITAPELPSAFGSATLDQILQAARQARPQDIVLFVGFREASPDLAVVGMSPTPIPAPGRFSRLVFDMRTGLLLGEEPPQESVMDIVLTLHRDMFTGLPGELFLGAMGLLLVLSIVSGVVIYAPFTRRIDFSTIRQRSRRLTWLDVHNLLGIITVVWLGVVAVTGTMNTLTVPLFDLWRAQTLPDLLKPYQGRPVAAPSSLDDAVARVRERLPGTTITSITMPTAARFGTPQHLVVWTKGASPLTARLFTPVLVDVVDRSVPLVVGELPWYLRFLQVSRPLHFGDYGSWPLKIIWALLDIISIIVLVSGLYLWWARLWRTPTALRGVDHRAPGAAVDVKAT